MSRSVDRSFRQIIAEETQAICELSEAQLDVLETHFGLLRHWNRRLNLTSVRNLEDVALHHYCESLFLGSLLPQVPVSIADVGSGAGFPGFPIAVMRPDCAVALIESNARKAVFLRESSRNVSNVRVMEGRASSLAERFDWVVSRAVAWRDLLPLIPGLASSVGLLVGEWDAEEILSRKCIAWAEPKRIPWRRRGFALLGRVACS